MASSTVVANLINREVENSDAWSLGCDITIEEMDVVVEEIRLNDIAIAGVVKTDGISVDIDHDKNNVMDLDVNVVIDGLNSSIIESQVVPYERVVEINDLSPESSYEKGFAASAKSVKKVKDSVDSLGNTVNTNTSNISKVASDVNSLTRRVDRLSQGAGGEDLGGIWYIDETTGNLVTDKQVEIKNNLIVGGDTASTGVGEDPGTTGIDEAQLKEYLDENKYITSDYTYSKQEIDNKIPSLNGYVTNEELTKTLFALNLGQYLKSEDAENTYAKITELKKYLLLESANQTIKGNITIEGNLVVKGDTASGAKGTDSGTDGTLIGVIVNGTQYKDETNGMLDLSSLMNQYAKADNLPTKTSLGLGNVENKSSATIRGEITATNVTNALGYTPTNNASLANYLSLSGGTINGTTSSPLKINTSSATIGIPLSVSNSEKAWFGWSAGQGAYLWNATANKYLGIKEDGTPHYNGNTLIHSGNIGSQKVERARYIETQAYDGSKWYADEYRLYAKWSASNILGLEVEGGYPIRVNQATKLQTARTIWGQSFDGTGNVSGALSGVTNINGAITISSSGDVTMSGMLTLAGTTAATAQIRFSREGANYIVYPSAGVLYISRGESTSTASVVQISSAGDTTIKGNLIVAGDTSSGSDIRFKDKLSDHRIAISDIAEAPLFTFKWNDREDKTEHLGSSAQYWENVAPWLVKGEDFKTLDYSTLGVAIGISLANKALNLEDRVKILEDKVKALEAENRRLRYGS